MDDIRIPTVESIRAQALALATAPTQDRFEEYFRLARELADRDMLPHIYGERLSDQLCTLGRRRLSEGGYPPNLLDAVGQTIVCICDMQSQGMIVRASRMALMV